MHKNKSGSNFTRADVELLEEKTVFQGYFRIVRYFLKHRLFGGGWSQPITREIFERGQAVGVLLFDPELNKIVLVEQFRPGVLPYAENPWMLELVAGMIGKNEQPHEVALRETQEETGLSVKDLIPICDYWVSPGGTSEKVVLFCAHVDATNAGGIHGLAEENEDIRVLVFDVQEVYAAVENGIIKNALSIIAIQWFQLHETEIRKRWKK